MPPAVMNSADLAEARAFAESVAGVLARLGAPADLWSPGEAAVPAPGSSAVAAALDTLGWEAVGGDPGLRACAGLGGVELGRALAPPALIDRLLGGSPVIGDLIRSPAPAILTRAAGPPVVARALLRAQACPSAEGLEVHRVLELGEPVPVDAAAWPVRYAAWLAAGVGYLAGLGAGALELTVEYARRRTAFGGTLAALAPVQQLLAGAATTVRGVSLLAADRPGSDDLAWAGPAITEACAACQQVSGAIGFTLEYPLHRFTQRARALATWNDALLDVLAG